MPAGFTGDKLPVGISFFGLAFSEQKLLSLGFSFEQATHTHTRAAGRYTRLHLREKRYQCPDELPVSMYRPTGRSPRLRTLSTITELCGFVCKSTKD